MGFRSEEHAKEGIPPVGEKQNGRFSSVSTVFESGFPGGQLEEGPKSGGQGGASPGRTVPASGLYRHEPEFAEPGGGAVLQQARDSRTVAQRGQAGSEDDAAELPPIPIQRGAAMVECDRLQPGEPMGAAGAAEED